MNLYIHLIMRLSKFFHFINKHSNKDVKLISHQLMIKSGMIIQISCGVYSWLPLGLIVLKNLQSVIREELKIIYAFELLLPNLQPWYLWKKSGKLNKKSDIKKQIFKFKSQKGEKYVIPPSGEEVITIIFKKYIKSYKNLDKLLYQISWKFRDEIRPRHGLIRCKEFLMKDAYSFDKNKINSLKSYEKIFICYIKVFHKLCLNVIPILANNGIIGGHYSHEFHIISEYGDSKIYYDNNLFVYLKKIKINLQMFNLEFYNKIYAKIQDKHFNNKNFNIKKIESLEIAHTFYLNNKYSKIFNCVFKKKYNNFVKMCCYGIGITRLLSVIIEKNHDKKGIIWPKLIVPFYLGIVNCNIKDYNYCVPFSNFLYFYLKKNNTLIYDDTNNTIKNKFIYMDLIGVLKQLIINTKYSIYQKIKIKNRITNKIIIIKKQELKNNIL